MPPLSSALERAGVAAALVLYHPDADVEARLRTILPHVATVYVVDNTPAADAAPWTPPAGVPVRVLHSGSNQGLGHAYNLCFRAASQAGYDAVICLDQDTELLPDYLDGMREAIASYAGPDRPGVLGPAFVHPDRPERVEHRHGDLVAVESVVSSGSLTAVDCWRDVGYRAGLFVDYVDIDFCLRARGLGWAVLSVGRVLMRHGMGNSSVNAILGGRYRRMTSNYPPLRHYYMARNAVLTARAVAKSAPGWGRREFVRRAKLTLLSLLMEPHRSATLAATLRGVSDGLRGREGAAR